MKPVVDGKQTIITETAAAAVAVTVTVNRFSFVFWFSILILTHSSWLLPTESLTISIGTYNLWNVMFNWEVRLQYMADVIRQNDLDIVVFQEVRSKCADNAVAGAGAPATTRGCPSQLEDVVCFLPEYRWVLAHPAGSVTAMKSSIRDDWQYEGLGIISRKPILSWKVTALRQTSFRDSNKRIALLVRVKVGPGGAAKDPDVGGVMELDIVIVHLSYDPQQQCDNSHDIIGLINEAGLSRPKIVVGDFNVYAEMSPAIGQFEGVSSGLAPCPKMAEKDLDGQTVAGTFRDAWLFAGQSHAQGLSFSNMPTPGLESRPDRILISKPVQVMDVGLSGNESAYWSRYQQAVFFHRAKAVTKAAYESFSGLAGYSCLYDCGPHGSCRCGVCVKGGNQNNCLLPQCSECSGGKFVIFLAISCIGMILLLVFILSVIRILVVSARFNQDDIMDILGYRCCLFNEQLFRYKFRVVPRRFKMRLMNALRLYNLPPALAAVVSLLLLCCVCVAQYVLFQDALWVVMSVLPEEKYPSDHKMVFAKLKLS